MITTAHRNGQGQSESSGEEWRIVGNEIIKGSDTDITFTLQDISVLPIEVLPENCTTEQARETIKGYILAADLTEEEITAITSLYHLWVSGEDLIADDLRVYGGVLYKTLQAHTTQSNWTPDISSSLFVVATPAGLIPDWEPPTSEKYYNAGDMMRYTDGLVYESLIDNNVWSPTAYPAGWQLVE